MPQVVFLRHGESVWNAENRFTGWTDVDLTERGVDEAKEAGRCMLEKGYKFDVVFTSVLKRAIKTAWVALEHSQNFVMPIVNSWRLNERHYGGLQGLDKAEVAAKHGDEQVKIWRRSYDVPPPEIDSSDKRHPCWDPRYSDVPVGALPGAESLKLTVDRVLPIWNDQIAPCILGGRLALVAAHGNSLRALCQIIEGMSEKEVLELNIPTAVPLVYELDSELQFIRKFYLMDPDVVAKKVAAVAAQGSAKKGGSIQVPLKMKTSSLWGQLYQHGQVMKAIHLKTLLTQDARNDAMFVSAEGITLDYCRQKVNLETMELLFRLADIAAVDKQKLAMFKGDKINVTEGRSVLHVALRAPRSSTIISDGKNVVPEVWSVLDAIKQFSDKVRNGLWTGHTGKPLTDVVCIGIGGSYLGVEFVLEALKTDPRASLAATGRRLRFLANVDPIDVKRALEGFSAESTLVVVISKTFTTAETMLNAKTVKEWLVSELKSEAAVAKHVVACSTALEKTKAFGIDPANVFGFWDWVGGRFSVCSAVGALPLSLQYGFDIFETFLQGCHKMDEHFRTAPPRENLPTIIGLLSVWNTSVLGYEGCAVLPYCQALVRFVAHIQQLDMESNGKRVEMHGAVCPVGTGALYFGEPGTNGQHSFYQLMHQGRVIPAEFIGFQKSQNHIALNGEPVANHDELMSNFFAQPDALALGKGEAELRNEGVPEKLIPHKVFPGDRPSLSMLLSICDAETLGKLLALYEHRTAVQGWVWGVNSFDQWGVELGKVLAKEVRTYLSNARAAKAPSSSKFIAPTKTLLTKYTEPNVWAALKAHAQELKGMHLRKLLDNDVRNDSMLVVHGNIILDYCRQKATQDTMDLLFRLAETRGIEQSKLAMFNGDKINETEGRSVLHVALRAPRTSSIVSDGKNVVPEVWSVLDAIKAFSEKVRSGAWLGHTGKALTDVVCIGIGGSYLGVEFVLEALKTDPLACAHAEGRRLRFLANVDPIDVRRALDGLSAETTLVVVISKTFTTAETMLNAQTVKQWLIQELNSDACIAKHVVACSTALDKTKAFGIDPANVFGFWDWVGGRFSVWSAVGALPLSLQYGFDVFEQFLEGAHSMDEHFRTAPPARNLPTIMGLLSLWNSSLLGYEGCAVLPYCQALVRFVAHIQQLDMESNGKRVQMDGSLCATSTGALYFGEPGTNGQHSFYQLMHQGRVIPAEFIGFKKSQNPIHLDGEPVANHDELMSNFFAQPDALALGKTEAQLKGEGVPENLIPHKVFTGDRPSLSLLLPTCDASTLGQLLALYEHRTAVQGWVWGINSFDQWGVELGKVLAKEVRGYLGKARMGLQCKARFIAPTTSLLTKYMAPEALMALKAQAQIMKGQHLKMLLADDTRNDNMVVVNDAIVLDYCRQKTTQQTMNMLFSLAAFAEVEKKKLAMFNGASINETEERSVLHVALRSPRDRSIVAAGTNVVPEVWSVLDSIKAFSDKVRSGAWLGHTGKPLKDVVCIGIGGSYLGVEFVLEALKTDEKASQQAAGRRLRFLANVDPIDVRRALDGLSAETTLVVVISKTFTTAETMLNARTVKDWLVKELKSDACVAKHVVACSTALEKTKAFGIDSANVFGFWDWVGGRFSVWSAVGALPLSLQYGFDIFEQFLHGAQIMDDHFKCAPPTANMPTIMALLSVWNTSFLGYESCAVLPYCQALVRFVAHIQQLDMESNGKRVQMDGSLCSVGTGALYFGEPGTNGQHSFYQLMHQGRVVPAEFIGFKKSQNPIHLDGEPVANHDELMSNFFAQPDALALGKTAAQLKAEGVPESLIPHKTFPGDRPSLSLLLPVCDAKALGQLLSLYEHRTAVQGWIWSCNSFDQWGVELGKVLAKEVRGYLGKARNGLTDNKQFIMSTATLLNRYMAPDLWMALKAHAQAIRATHLKMLLADDVRSDAMIVAKNGIVLDYCRQKVTRETMALLFRLADVAGVDAKRQAMFNGNAINETEGRSVLHVALRAPRNSSIISDGKNVVPEVWSVLDSIKAFSEKVRSGAWKGHTGKPLTDVVCIGIGGSYLGVEFVFEALKTDPKAAQQATGKRLRFLANVDPIDVRRALDGLAAETTLVVVISKTFTTAETMLNAKTVKDWLISELKSDACVAKHVVACSTALDKTKAFGIDPANVFGFWDWVGGRFSVCSAVGALPLSLQYGFDVFERFLGGCHAMDEHFRAAPPEENLPMLLGLLTLWNTSILGYEGCAILPYCQALVRFVAHIQQLDMESNGKRVQMDGSPCTTSTGALYFGEPGTNGQHSFYQLMHQGRAIPAEFIGFKKSQNPIELDGEPVANHDELMSNFFAQPDALALGKTETQLKAEGVPEKLIPHKVFPGDRPSLSLLMPICDSHNLGQLLALYEHRTAVQGWVWGLNSFDQWGVELGKVLAKEVRGHLSKARQGAPSTAKLIQPTAALLEKYV